MITTEIAIICKGTEISYGLNLKHLFNFEKGSEHYNSILGHEKAVELYTPAVFKSENVSQKSAIIRIGDISQVNEQYSEALTRFGMNVFKSGNTFVVYADPSKITDKEYSQFIAYANMKRNEYMNIESEYYNLISSSDPMWISGEFIQTSRVGLFAKSNNLHIKKQMQYDCLSYILYLDYLKYI